METVKQDWYSNKELYEMQVDLSKRMEQLSAELLQTQTLIRDYNGLRTRLDGCERRIEDMTGHARGGQAMWGYLVGGIGLVMGLIGWVVR